MHDLTASRAREEVYRLEREESTSAVGNDEPAGKRICLSKRAEAQQKTCLERNYALVPGRGGEIISETG